MGETTGGRIKTGSIIGTDLSLLADVPAETMRHCFKAGTNFATAIGATPVAREEIVYVASGPGVVKGFHALCNETGSSASVTFDLKKNGTTVLTGVITITNATAGKQVQDATLSGIPTLVAGDILSMALAVSSSTGMQGAYAFVTIQETSAPV